MDTNALNKLREKVLQDLDKVKHATDIENVELLRMADYELKMDITLLRAVIRAAY